MHRTIAPVLVLLVLTFGTRLIAADDPGMLGIGGPSLFKPDVQDESVQQITRWLNRAPAVTPVACTVERTLAPEAVANFERISAEVATIYSRVHAEAQAVSTEVVSVGAEAPDSTTGVSQDVMSREAQQAEVTATYQETLQEIEACRKALTHYTESLRLDGAIAGFSSRIQQTLILAQFGRDAYQLGEQLKAAGEGAVLILQQRLNETHDK